MQKIAEIQCSDYATPESFSGTITLNTNTGSLITNGITTNSGYLINQFDSTGSLIINSYTGAITLNSENLENCVKYDVNVDTDFLVYLNSAFSSLFLQMLFFFFTIYLIFSITGKICMWFFNYFSNAKN